MSLNLQTSFQANQTEIYLHIWSSSRKVLDEESECQIQREFLQQAILLVPEASFWSCSSQAFERHKIEKVRSKLILTLNPACSSRVVRNV